MSGMEEGVAGFLVEGKWDDIVEHGERITSALRDAGYSSEALAEWDDWRPKAHERLGREVKERTAAYAHLKDGPGEQADQLPIDDVHEASEELIDAYERLPDTDEALAKWYISIQYWSRAVVSIGRKTIRAVEDVIYKHVMTKVSPFYFDNELISANISESRLADGPVFTFEVNVNDDDLKTAVSERLRRFENEVNRWHLDVKNGPKLSKRWKVSILQKIKSVQSVSGGAETEKRQWSVQTR